MNSILVPTDFSKNAFKALQYAIQLAIRLDYSISVVHAFSMPPTGSAVMVNISEILEKNANEELAMLKDKVDREVPEAKKVSMIYNAHHGPVVDVINRLSVTRQHSMVVMGTQGETDLADKWLGTNASDASKNVKIPLLILPSDTTIPSNPEFLFAADMKVLKNEKAFIFMSEVVNKLNTHIKFVHVKNRKLEEAQVNSYKAQLDKHFGGDRAKITYITNSDVEEGITEAVRDQHPDILVIVRQDYSFLDSIFRTSVSQKLIRTAALPILVLQA